jgi:hypothetical protein
MHGSPVLSAGQQQLLVTASPVLIQEVLPHGQPAVCNDWCLHRTLLQLPVHTF